MTVDGVVDRVARTSATEHLVLFLVRKVGGPLIAALAVESVEVGLNTILWGVFVFLPFVQAKLLVRKPFDCKQTTVCSQDQHTEKCPVSRAPYRA